MGQIDEIMWNKQEHRKQTYMQTIIIVTDNTEAAVIRIPRLFSFRNRQVDSDYSYKKFNTFYINILFYCGIMQSIWP